jgi:hypothetical protein
MPPRLIVDGLLLKAPITGGCPVEGTVVDAGMLTVKQPGIRISNANSDKERKTIIFTVVTSKNTLSPTSKCP